jgi:hypothetical protein
VIKFQIPIINFALFDKDYKGEHSLKLEFEKTKEELIKAVKVSLIKK